MPKARAAPRLTHAGNKLRTRDGERKPGKVASLTVVAVTALRLLSDKRQLKIVERFGGCERARLLRLLKADDWHSQRKKLFKKKNKLCKQCRGKPHYDSHVGHLCPERICKHCGLRLGDDVGMGVHGPQNHCPELVRRPTPASAAASHRSDSDVSVGARAAEVPAGGWVCLPDVVPGTDTEGEDA